MAKNSKSTASPKNGARKSIVLRGDEKALLHKLDDALIEAKVEFADLSIEMEVLKQRQNVAMQRIVNAQMAVNDRLRLTAMAHDIDVDDPSKGRWNLDMATMVFTRTD